MAIDIKKDPFALESGVPGVPSIGNSLRPTPMFADRISKRVLGAAFAVVVVVVGIFLLALDQMDKKPIAKPPVMTSEKPGVTQTNAKLPAELSGSGSLESTDGAVSVLPTLPQSLAATTQQTVVSNTIGSTPSNKAVDKKGSLIVPPINTDIPKDQIAVPPVVPALTPEQQEAQVQKMARLQRTSQAKTSGMQARSFNAAEGSATGAGTSLAGGGSPTLADILAAVKTTGALSGGAQSSSPVKSDGEQDEKLDFVKNAGKENPGYHPHIPLQALSQKEIKIGSFIPMTLETSINSDLPGQITARVTEDVYDSMTGCRMLIPAMSKVVGKYDSKIALGQGRMLVVWNAMIFPDGSELNLAAMQGYATSGQSGLESDVDNHYLRMFGLTFGLSMITAGVQLSVPQPNPGINGAPAQQSSSQIVAAALAQQYGMLGAQILGKYMAVQPTLRNFAGERFIVMVPRTMVLPKVWRNRCSSN